jgi:SAM-dependent methyltransferase
VFDYGAGRGGEWPIILAGRPDITLICYEPAADDAAALTRALAGSPKARVVSQKELEAGSFKADYVISFSVFEHVVDRVAYLAHAKRCLAPEGVFHLNYDDGHFRTSLDLDEKRLWRQNLAVTLQNALAWLWPRIGRWERYQSRVMKSAIDPRIAEVGFRIADERYENMIAMKEVWKTLPDERRQDFTRMWISLEDELNASFRVDAEMRMGDTVNLWRQLGSRTLQLKHA